MKKISLALIFLLAFCLSPIPNYARADNAPEKRNETLHTYVVFFGFTERGMQNIKDSPARVEAAARTVEAMGGKVKAFYGILGSQFDTMFILEAPDDEVVAKMVLAIAKGGYVRTETHRLFTKDEYNKIISALP